MARGPARARPSHLKRALYAITFVAVWLAGGRLGDLTGQQKYLENTTRDGDGVKPVEEPQFADEMEARREESMGTLPKDLESAVRELEGSSSRLESAADRSTSAPVRPEQVSLETTRGPVIRGGGAELGL